MASINVHTGTTIRNVNARWTKRLEHLVKVEIVVRISCEQSWMDERS